MAIHQLAIGNNYPGSSSELYGCCNDARDSVAEWSEWSTTQTVLVNNKADRENVFKAGRKIKERLQPGDLWLLSISGHGTREKTSKGWVEAMVFADFELGYDYEVAAWFDNRPENTFVAVFADCCHSGGFARGFNNPHRIKAIPIDECHTHTIDKSHRLFRRDRALPDVVYFSGCETDEYSYDGRFSNRPEGAMTHYLRKAWRERRENGTFKQLYQRLAGKRPRGYLPNDEYDQHPIYIGSAKNMNRTFKSFLR